MIICRLRVNWLGDDMRKKKERAPCRIINIFHRFFTLERCFRARTGHIGPVVFAVCVKKSLYRAL